MKPLKFILSLFLFGTLITGSYAQNYIMEGIIGKKPAVIGFEKDELDIYEAKYFLRSNQTVVELESYSLDTNTVIFYTLDANNEDTFSVFNLTFSEDGLKLNGNFNANDGLVEEVYFTWLDITKIDHKYAGNNLIEAFKVEQPFLYTYTSGIVFNRNTKEIMNGKYDKLTIVTNAPNEIPTIRFINPGIEEKEMENFCDSIGIEQIVAAIDCGLEYEVILMVKRFDQNLISLLYKVSWNCGGPNSDYYLQGLTFNRKTGKQLLLRDLFVLENEDTSNDSLNRLAVKANEKKIRGLVKETLKNDGGSLCDYDNYPLFGDKNYYLDKGNLHFLPTFPKPLATCRNSDLSKLSIVTIKGQLKPEVIALL